MIPYSRPKCSDLYTLSQSKLLEKPIYGSIPPPGGVNCSTVAFIFDVCHL